MTSVITDSIKLKMEAWRGAFIGRWGTQPPEFFSVIGSIRNEEHYSSNIGCLTNPIHTEWFQQLVREATLADLDAIESHPSSEEEAGTPVQIYHAYRRFFQEALLKAAKKAHDEGRPYSEEIPLWFRFKDWNIGPKWKCEVRRLEVLLESLRPH
jgi:hypothetical protein